MDIHNRETYFIVRLSLGCIHIIPHAYPSDNERRLHRERRFTLLFDLSSSIPFDSPYDVSLFLFEYSVQFTTRYATTLHCASLCFTVLHCTLTINDHVGDHNDERTLKSIRV